MFAGAKIEVRSPQGDGEWSGVGGSGQPTSRASVPSAENLAPPSLEPACEAQTNRLVTARLTIASNARQAVSEIDLRDYWAASSAVWSFTQHTQSLIVNARRDGQLGHASVQAELVEAIKAAEAVSRLQDWQFTGQVMPSIMDTVTAAMDGLEGPSVQQIVAHWTSDVFKSAGGSSSLIGGHHLAVSAAVFRGVIAKTNDKTFVNEHILPGFLAKFLPFKAYGINSVGKTPIGHIAEALMATGPETWNASDRTAVYEHLQDLYGRCLNRDYSLGGCGIRSESFLDNFRALALACKPPSDG